VSTAKPKPSYARLDNRSFDWLASLISEDDDWNFDDSFPEYTDFKGNVKQLIQSYENARAWIKIVEAEVKRLDDLLKMNKYLWAERYNYEFGKNYKRGERLDKLFKDGIPKVGHLSDPSITQPRKANPIPRGLEEIDIHESDDEEEDIVAELRAKAQL
jgi:hypothetical protein